MTRALQIELFALAFAKLEKQPDLVNQVLEVTAEDEAAIAVRRYGLPVEPESWPEKRTLTACHGDRQHGSSRHLVP